MKQRPRLKPMARGYNFYDKYSDDSGDEIDLPVRKVLNPQQYIEAQVQEGDTLQAIAIRFNCPITKLMRANNILRENEIFAKKVLKIPISAYSLITESIPMVHTSGNNSPTKSKTTTQVIVCDDNKNIPTTPANTEELQQKLIVASVNAAELQSPEFLSNYPRTASDTGQNSLLTSDVCTPLIVNEISRTGVESVIIKEFTSKGDNLGIKWLHLFVCILVLCLVIPFIYVAYVAEHHEKLHHHHDSLLP